jgi:rRNA maturation endonuclease Nob1
MGLTDSLRRLMGRTDEEERPAYACTTCGREYDSKRTVCTDCNGHVREAPAG